MRMRTLVLTVVAALGAAVLAYIALAPAPPGAANSIERLSAYQDPALLKQA